MHYPVSISFRHLLKLFFAPDIFNFYSPAYAWFVNQAGHALIGLLLALLLHTFLALHLPVNTAFFVVAALGLLGYAAKELNDYRVACALDKKAPEALRVPRLEILLDMIADWSFVNSGVLTGAALSAWYFSGSNIWLWAAGCLALCFVVFIKIYGRIYITNKLLWQKSRLPRLHDIAHCDSELLNSLGEHFQQQVQQGLQSTYYVGTFAETEALLVGLARRAMVTRLRRQRRVRYWQQDELLAALNDAPADSSPGQPWGLHECDVVILWLTLPMPALNATQLDQLNGKVLLLAGADAELWSGLDVAKVSVNPTH